MKERVVLSGFGGQGILSSGLLLAEMGVLSNYYVTYFPSYGAEMRGGTANCHVIISDKPISSPIITQIDTLIAMNKPSIIKFYNIIKENGLIITNVLKEEISNTINSIDIISYQAEKIALEQVGITKVTNIILLGVYLKKTKLISIDNAKKVIYEKFIVKGKEIVDSNIKALEIGYSLLS